MSRSMKLITYYILTIVSNVGFVIAIHVLSTFDWWFLIYLMWIFVPLFAFSISSFLLLWSVIKDKFSFGHRIYFFLSCVNAAIWILYSIYKGISLQWGGH